MHDTGLIVRPLLQEARAIVFDRDGAEQRRETLRLLAMIDQAHTVMLVETGVIARALGGDALRASRALVASNFASLVEQDAVRGIYMVYEAALAEKASGAADVHVGRSRNDINATLFALKCRRAVAALAAATLRIVRSIDASIGRHGAVAMPLFSHRRPGMPATWELYLDAVAGALLRDAASLVQALECLDTCALGAGAGAGTEVPIEPKRTAELLGFGSPVANALAAVAARDAGLRAVAAAAILASNLSRTAGDLMNWFAEQDAVVLPDELVGASSVMPQKRNAFMLEHVIGKAGRVAGALSGALSACQVAPYANAVQVSTEAVGEILEGLAHAHDAATLMALLIDGAEPVAERFDGLGRRGAVGATALALKLRRERGVTFREAHHRVGELLRVSGSDDPVADAAAALELEATRLRDPAVMVFGGGAGDGAAAQRATVRSELTNSAELALGRFRETWRAAEQRLHAAVDAILSSNQEDLP